MINYLCDYRTKFCSNPQIYMDNEKPLEIYNMNECKAAINKWIEDDKYVKDNFNNNANYQ